MRTLFFVLSLFLLSSCAQMQQFVFGAKEPILIEGSLLSSCDYFPYDNSDSRCNLIGWQAFTSKSLRETKEEHGLTLASLGNSLADNYKLLILKSSYYEPFNVRMEATEGMFKVADLNDNSFGNFFYLLATYNKHALLNKRNAMNYQTKLKTQTQKSGKLQKQLNEAQAKIEAIMDIEKNLNTN